MEGLLVFGSSKPKKPELIQTIMYVTEKRDDALEHLNDGIKQYLSKKIIMKRLNSVLKINKQLKLLEDALVVSRTNGEDKK